MKLTDRIRACREAGMVERCHNVPHFGSYNDAAHTWNVCIIIRLLWPDRMDLVDFALFHDVPERWTGDVPSPVIRDNPDLRRALTAKDTAISLRLEIPSEHALGPDDLACLKFADRFELYLWCCEQEAMGNKMVLHMKDSLRRMFDEALYQLPARAREVFLDFEREGFYRLKETLE